MARRRAVKEWTENRKKLDAEMMRRTKEQRNSQSVMEKISGPEKEHAQLAMASEAY